MAPYCFAFPVCKRYARIGSSRVDLNRLPDEVAQWLKDSNIRYAKRWAKWDLPASVYTGNKTILRYELVFIKKSDLVAFKLAWGGKDALPE